MDNKELKNKEQSETRQKDTSISNIGTKEMMH